LADVRGGVDSIMDLFVAQPSQLVLELADTLFGSLARLRLFASQLFGGLAGLFRRLPGLFDGLPRLSLVARLLFGSFARNRAVGPDVVDVTPTIEGLVFLRGGGGGVFVMVRVKS
jgi:hypothetical protein